MFSLPFKLRRKSDTDHRSVSSRRGSATAAEPPLSRISSASQARARSQSHGGKALSRTLSNTLSKRLSFFSNQDSSDDLNSLVSSTSEFATQELTRFKTLNHERFPREVLQYLKFQGLSAPTIVQESTHTRISVSSSGENVFLPSLINITEEEQQNLELNSPNPTSNVSRPTTAHNSETPSTTGESEESSVTTPHPAHTPLQTHIDDSVDPIPHTFAVIVSLPNPTPITNIKTQLQAICSIQWPKGLPSDRSIKNEKFELGQASWELSLSNYNYFVPESEDAIEDDEDDWEHYSDDPTSGSKFLTEQKIPSKKVELRSFEQVTRGGYAIQKRDQDPFVLGALNGNSTAVMYPAGHYVFLLPILFEPNLPESLLTSKAHVSYALRTVVVQKSKNYQYGEHYVRVIRAPPVTGITTADKPIFVSKVWNDTLSYEISFPKKYVTLGTEIPFKMKFIPLEKKVTIKRVKVNVIEKVTYVSKSLEYEYDEHLDDSEETYLQANGNEKIIPLFEVRTKPRNSKAAREECVEDAAVFDNLLSCCYKAEHDSTDKKTDQVEIVGPLSISTYLPFIRPHKSARTFPHTQKTFFQSVVHTDKTKPQASKELKTRVSNQNYNVNTVSKINHTEEGLLPDSLNNRYINIEHKLQICVRISKTDAKDNKVHHYEVIIDTPIFLLNSSCVPESVELPAYSDVHAGGPERLPTFDEVLMSPMNSPALMPYNEETVDSLSRISTMTGSALDYDNIDSLMTDSSASLGRRRSTSAKVDMVNSFRRTLSLSQPPSLPPSASDMAVRRDGAGSSSSSASSGRDSQEIPDAPPPYVESVALMSDESGSDEEDEEDLGDDTFVNADQSTDLTEQFHRAVYGDYA